MNKTDSVPVFLQVELRPMDIPSEGEHLLEAIFLYLVEQKLHEMRANDCEACELNCSGQGDHMSGCLMEWHETVALHAEEAKGIITHVDILRLYHDLMKFMGMPSLCSVNTLEKIANFTAPDDLEDKLKYLPNSNIFHDLLTTCSTI